MTQAAQNGSMSGAGAGTPALALPPGVHLSARRSDEDPLAPVFVLGDRAVQVGAVIGVTIALLLHGYASVRAVTALFDMRRFAEGMHSAMHEYFWAQYEVDLTPKKAPEEKPPEKEPEPEVVLPQPAPRAHAAPKDDDPYEPPPAPAQAAKVITAPSDPDEPLDFTGDGFVSGDGTGLGYGMVSGKGRSATPTYSPHASNSGVQGGQGTSAAPPPPPPAGPDRTRAPSLAGGTSWDCPFPGEADAEQIDHAIAVIMVVVRPDGTPQSVKVVTDPGYGFGRQARICALGRKYTPGLDRDGNPVSKQTPPITVRFTR
jgi:protein TonB